MLTKVLSAFTVCLKNKGNMFFSLTRLSGVGCFVVNKMLANFPQLNSVENLKKLIIELLLSLTD